MGLELKDGLVRASDGSDARDVGDWSAEKHYYLKRTIDMFTTAMRGKWQLVYIDLFAGPGKCLMRESGEEVDGSPLIALKSRYKFHKYIFVENDTEAMDALKERVRRLGIDVECHFMEKDCNASIDDIRQHLSLDTLALTFIDPTGLQITWQSVKKLTAGVRMDLLLNFMYGMALKRNMKKWVGLTNSALDTFLPETIDWRTLFEEHDRNIRRTSFALLNQYVRELNRLGYLPVNVEDEALRIRNSNKVTMYLLLFFSKHELGMKFWCNNIAKKYLQGELGLYE